MRWSPGLVATPAPTAWRGEVDGHRQTGLNEALAADGIGALGPTWPGSSSSSATTGPGAASWSPPIQPNRAEIREIFRSQMPDAPGRADRHPAALTGRRAGGLRPAFLSASVGVSGASWRSPTGSLVVVASAGDGRSVRKRCRARSSRGGDREDPAVLAGPGGVPGAAAPGPPRPSGYRPRTPRPGPASRRGRAAGLPPGAAGQRPRLRAGRPDRQAGAALHQVLGLPGRAARSTAATATPTARRTRGPDRRRSVCHCCTASPPGRHVPLRMPPPCAVPATGVPGRDRHPRGPGPPARARLVDAKRRKPFLPNNHVFQLSGRVSAHRRPLAACQRGGLGRPLVARSGRIGGCRRR